MPKLLNNRYQVIQVLGDGGFGKTFLAEDTQMPSSRKCVVKQLKPIHDNSVIHQLVQERFQREAALLEELGDSHGQIPRLYAYFAEEGEFYLVEEWVEGDTLTQKLHKERLFSEASVREILANLLPVIDYIHQRQIVHRDIKPDNIILRQRDTKPVLIDFGAVKETMGTVLTSQGNSSRSIVVGTTGYMPSEQLAGRPIFASDLYSLGMTAIYMLTGKMPQELDSDPLTGEMRWKHYAPGISTGFANFLDKAIQLQPRDRFTTAQEMQTALSSLGSLASLPPATSVSAAPIPTATIVSATPLISSNLDTINVSPSAPHGQPTVITTALPSSALASSTNDWHKAVIIGGIIGASILVGAFLIGQKLPGSFQTASSPKAEPTVSKSSGASTSKPTQANTAVPIVSPAQVPQQPVVDPPAQSQSSGQAPPPAQSTTTNATIVGDPGQKNIRYGPGSGYGVHHIAYPGDRVVVTGSDRESNGFLWYKVYFPNSGADGWIANHLLEVDGQSRQAAPPPQSIPQQQPNPVAVNSGTNAVIVGEPGQKNIRSGPGTAYGVQHIAYPGDRVRILGSDYDRGGYLWYKVYFPNSGADGWIAAQLISRN